MAQLPAQPAAQAAHVQAPASTSAAAHDAAPHAAGTAALAGVTRSDDEDNHIGHALESNLIQEEDDEMEEDEDSEDESSDDEEEERELAAEARAAAMNELDLPAQDQFMQDCAEARAQAEMDLIISQSARIALNTATNNMDAEVRAYHEHYAALLLERYARVRSIEDALAAGRRCD